MAFLDLIVPMARVTVEILFNSLLPGIALTALLWGLLRLVRGINATTRYLIWYVTLLAVICLPLFVFVSHPSFKTGPTPLSASVEPTPAPTSRTGASDEDPTGDTTVGTPVEGVDASQQVMLRFRPPVWRFPEKWVLLVFGGWLLVVVSLMARLVWSYSHLQRVKRRSLPLTLKDQRRLQQWLNACGVRRRVQLRSSPRIPLPMAVGLINPAILLPESLPAELTETELHQVLLHELAHLQRWDDWSNLGQKLIQAVFFFHPAIVWIGRRLDLEREVACDDWVIAMLGGDSRSYAASLTKLMELTLNRQQPLLDTGFMIAKTKIEERINLLLDKKRKITSRVSKVRLLATLGVLMIGVLLFARVTPGIAVFKQPRPHPKLELVATALDSRLEAPLNQVWVHGDYAYVGGHNPGYWRSPPNEDPGVRILDISNPEKPVLVARIPLAEGRRAPFDEDHHLNGDAVVTHLETEAFVGDVAAVLNGVPPGTSVSSDVNPIGIWDVTDPKSPKFLSHVEFGAMYHNDSYLRQTSIGGTLLFAIFGTGEMLLDLPYFPAPMISDVGIADLSDPRNPVIKAVWNDAETKPYITNVRANADGTRLYISGIAPPPYGWAAEFGLLYILDTTDPAEPTEIGRYTYDLEGVPSEPLAVPHEQKELVIVGDGSWGVEPLAGNWGHLHIIDISDLSNIREISTFKIPESDEPAVGEKLYDTLEKWWPTLQFEVQGDLVFSTWLSGGLYVVDISDPAQPVEVAHFVPTGPDQHMFGVYPKDDLILAARVWNSGLYIFRLSTSQ